MRGLRQYLLCVSGGAGGGGVVFNNSADWRVSRKLSILHNDTTEQVIIEN